MVRINLGHNFEQNSRLISYFYVDNNVLWKKLNYKFRFDLLYDPSDMFSRG